VFESNYPEFGWKRQKAKVSGLGLIMKGDRVALLNAKSPFIRSPILGSKLLEDGGSDCLSIAMEWTVETLIFPPKDLMASS
jgi:hypothetical protein